MDSFEGILHRESMYNVCVRVCVRARVHVKGDCGNLKCNPPLENPAYGLVVYT